MRAVVVFVLVLVLVPAAAAVTARAETLPFAWTHVRPLSSEARRLVVQAAERSSHIRSQYDRLEKTDVIVYVNHSAPRPGVNVHGHMVFISAAIGLRFVGIWVDALSEPFDRLSLLGHELQHALEVAASPSVRDDKSMAEYFSRIGRKTADLCYETTEAVVAGLRVREDLAQNTHARSNLAVPALPGRRR